MNGYFVHSSFMLHCGFPHPTPVQAKVTGLPLCGLSAPQLHGKYGATCCSQSPSPGVTWVFLCLFFFCIQAYRLSAYKTWQNHSENPRTLGVLCPLLVVEGQGAHPRASGNIKQVWVCSADAGVCHAWKAAGEISKKNGKSANQKKKSLGRSGLAHEPRREMDIICVVRCALNRRACLVTRLHSSGVASLPLQLELLG